MNQGRIWCVVKPTVGLPLFLGGVTTIALLVHGAVMTNTTWMSSYWQGGARRAADAAPPGQATVAQATPGYSITVTPATGAGDGSFVVTVTPHVAGNTAAQAVVVPEQGRASGNTLALAGPSDRSD